MGLFPSSRHILLSSMVDDIQIAAWRGFGLGITCPTGATPVITGFSAARRPGR
jgi:hypothetical protein